MGDTGLEQSSISSLKPAILSDDDAPNDARRDPSATVADSGDTDLARLLAVWSELSPDDRAAIVAHAEVLAAGRPAVTTAEIRRGLIDRLFS